jgi:8-oxo-dGTP diphosphatase
VSAPRHLHVAVGLVADERSRWLVNCRPPGAPLAGWWEFPGGKCLPGEAPLEALRRELAEELGIAVLEAQPVLALEHDYPDKRVRLDVWRVWRYSGEVIAREGQELRWVTAAECRELALLEADWPIVAELEAWQRAGDQQIARSKRTS